MILKEHRLATVLFLLFQLAELEDVLFREFEPVVADFHHQVVAFDGVFDVFVVVSVGQFDGTPHDVGLLAFRVGQDTGVVLVEDDGLVSFVIFGSFVGAGIVVEHLLVFETVFVLDAVDEFGDGVADGDVDLIFAAHVRGDGEEEDTAVVFAGDSSLAKAGTVFISREFSPEAPLVGGSGEDAFGTLDVVLVVGPGGSQVIEDFFGLLVFEVADLDGVGAGGLTDVGELSSVVVDLHAFHGLCVIRDSPAVGADIFHGVVVSRGLELVGLGGLRGFGGVRSVLGVAGGEREHHGERDEDCDDGSD